MKSKDTPKVTDRVKTYFKTHAWARYALAAFAGFTIGLAMTNPTPTPAQVRTETKTVEVEKRVEVAPLTCKKAINMDNQIFTKVGEGLGSLDFAGITTYLDSVKAERTAAAADCLSK